MQPMIRPTDCTYIELKNKEKTDQKYFRSEFLSNYSTRLVSAVGKELSQ